MGSYYAYGRHGQVQAGTLKAEPTQPGRAS
jgi:hypothetical protein